MATSVPPRSDPATAELLRFATAGSVDDGKSTLIGRLLWEQGDTCAKSHFCMREG